MTLVVDELSQSNTISPRPETLNELEKSMSEFENKTSSRRSYHLKNLYLDPNNYRFVDHKDYQLIGEAQLTDDGIQKRSRFFIEGEKREHIKDLLDSFKANGFLEVDVIQVRDLGENNFLVLEGNRRVTALKALQQDYEKGLDIGELEPTIFKSVPFQIHENKDQEKHRIIMGLKHISGNKKWSAVNQAKLIYDFLEPYWEHDYEVQENKLAASLAISKMKLRNSQRAYSLILAYKESDFGDQFRSNMYSFFAEIVKRPPLRKWLDWNEDDYEAENYINLQRLFSWLSTTDEITEDLKNEDEVLDISNAGTQEPIITKSAEIRDLVSFINNEDALEVMEKTGEFYKGLIASGVVERQEYESIVSQLRENISRLGRYKDSRTVAEIEQLTQLSEAFANVLPERSSLDMQRGNVGTCFEMGKIQHFKSIKFERYKAFQNFEITKLNRINIFVGTNNAGKTSLLEGIYLLTKQNDAFSFFEMLKLKNKLSALNPAWLNQVFDDEISISGEFNETTTSIKIKKFEATNIDKKDDYIASYEMKATIDSRPLTNTIHTFGYQAPQRDNQRVEHLCPSIFKSPYFYNLDEILLTHNRCVEVKIEGKSAMSIIIEFLKQIDPAIDDIKLTDAEHIKRFIVDSNLFKDKNRDITEYGEGLQRTFEIALSFAYARNGVILIDEFETAIHHNLLVEFTKFIQTLANIFNVQVFLSTHSKECVDAFVNNGYENKDISAYLIQGKGDQILTKQVGGDRLQYLVENMDFDIRGGDNG